MRAEQHGPDALVRETVGGVRVRCYAQRPRTVVELLEGALAAYGSSVLLVDPALGRSVTYDEFARLVEGAAATLLDHGAAPGDRVAVLLRNGLEAAVAIWACARAGLLHVGLPHDAPPARLRALVELTAPSLLLAQPDLPAGDLGLPVLPAALLLAQERAWRTGASLPDEDATYCLIATSGTTGGPKAVRVTGRMTGHAAAFYSRTLGLGPADRTAVHLPFAWVSGHVTQLCPAMLSGGSVVTMASFSAPLLVEVAREHAVTWLDVVPSIWELLLRTRAFCLPDLAGLRLAVFGGAPAPPGTLHRVRERLPQLRLYDVYALSETCAPVTCLPDGEMARRPGSVGRPVPYCDVRLAGPRGSAVARGEPGEVWVRGPVVTPGYWGGEPLAMTADGWLRTGDIARMDDEGYLLLGGRSVDLVIRGGVNIFPAEVERALLSAGSLSDAAVFGVPSALTGENVAAAVVGRPGHPVDVRALQQQVSSQLGAHAVPRPVHVLDELPRGGNGKVDRGALRARLSDEPNG